MLCEDNHKETNNHMAANVEEIIAFDESNLGEEEIDER